MPVPDRVAVAQAAIIAHSPAKTETASIHARTNPPAVPTAKAAIASSPAQVRPTAPSPAPAAAASRVAWAPREPAMPRVPAATARRIPICIDFCFHSFLLFNEIE